MRSLPQGTCGECPSRTLRRGRGTHGEHFVPLRQEGFLGRCEWNGEGLTAPGRARVVPAPEGGLSNRQQNDRGDGFSASCSQERFPMKLAGAKTRIALRSILVALDFSRSSEPALLYAS